MGLKVEPQIPLCGIVHSSQGLRRETCFPVRSLTAMRPDASGRGSTGEFRHSRYPQRQYLIVAGLLFHLFVSIRVIRGQAVLGAVLLLAIPVTAAEYSIKPGDDVDAAIAKKTSVHESTRIYPGINPGRARMSFDKDRDKACDKACDKDQDKD